MADNQQPLTKQKLADSRIDVVAAMRDMTAEILCKLETFSQDYFARLDRLEHSKIALNKRLKGLEDRVMALETRPPSRKTSRLTGGRQTTKDDGLSYRLATRNP